MFKGGYRVPAEGSGSCLTDIIINILINMNEYTIFFTWDDESSVWIAESNDLPGLILESGSFDALIERVKFAVPELLELSEADHTQVKLHFKADRLAVVA